MLPKNYKRKCREKARLREDEEIRYFLDPKNHGGRLHVSGVSSDEEINPDEDEMLTPSVKKSRLDFDDSDPQLNVLVSGFLCFKGREKGVLQEPLPPTCSHIKLIEKKMTFISLAGGIKTGFKYCPTCNCSKRPVVEALAKSGFLGLSAVNPCRAVDFTLCKLIAASKTVAAVSSEQWVQALEMVIPQFSDSDGKKLLSEADITYLTLLYQKITKIAEHKTSSITELAKD